MNAPAAIAGTFSDLRTIKTRGVCQLYIEIPIEQADAALAALGGVPQPGKERWVGIAPLETSPRSAPRSSAVASDAEASGESRATPAGAGREPKRKPLSPGSRAALMCKDPRSWPLLEGLVDGAPVDNETDAAVVVRVLCDVTSRSQLTDANKYWRTLEADYLQAIGRL